MKKLSLFPLALLALNCSATITDSASFRALPMVVVWGAVDYAENSPITTPVASDYLLLTTASNTVAPDLIAGNVYPVVTGTLSPAASGSNGAGSLIAIGSPAAAPAGGGVLTDNPFVGSLTGTDSLTKFGMTAATNLNFSTTINRSFYVSSNAAFNIYAQSGTPVTSGVGAGFDGAIISMNMSLTQNGTDSGLAFGTSAQLPTTGGSGFVGLPRTLNTITAPTKVYGAGRKTASTPGTVAAQSVRFNTTYAVVGGYGLDLGTGSISIPVTFNIYVP